MKKSEGQAAISTLISIGVLVIVVVLIILLVREL